MLTGLQQSCGCKTRFLTTDGSFRWMEARGWPVIAPDGAITGISGVLDDITERKQAEEELQVQRDFALYVVNTMGQGLTVTGADSKWTYVNPAFAAMLGYSPEDLVGRQPEDFTFAEDVGRLDEAILARRTGRTTSYETRLHRADGGTVYAFITGSPHRRGDRIIGSVAVVTDLTERKQIEEALAAARDQALEASRLKSEFLATMSHEIRTPMNSILGMNELLLSTSLSEAQREYADAVQVSAEGLLSLIDDILDFSKIEAGKLALAEIDFELRPAVDRACDMFAPKVRAKGLSLTAAVAPDVPEWLRGDAGRLHQVLVNLIGNAVKFTDQGGVEVTVCMTAVTDASCTLRFEVADTGMGISQSAHQRLFQPFTQADGSMTRKYGGTGLGLAISRRLVELMGGEIGVDSEEGAGACFWFTMQCKYASGDPATLQAATTARGSFAGRGHRCGDRRTDPPCRGQSD